MKAIKKKPTMAVIRGIRSSEALFYDAFKKFKIKFIYFSQKPTSYPVQTENLKLVNLGLEPKYFWEPISFFNRGLFTHRSWAEVKDLEEHLKGVEVINISGVFHHWCSQAAWLASRLGKKLVTIVWETIPRHPGIWLPPYSFNVRQVIVNTDLFILRSKKARQFTDSVGIPRRKTKVIYKGIDLSRFYPPKPCAPSSKLSILYVGQLDKSKGIDDLLKAFVLLVEKFPNAELRLAGRGLMAKTIDKFAKRYPIKNLGFVDYDDLADVYRQADIFCSPSKEIRYLGFKIWEELFSYTLMEAQASGLPIVATKCGGIPEEVGEGNLLVDQADVRGVYQALKKLAGSDKLRIAIGKRNRRQAEKFFDLKKQAEKTEEAILL